MPKISRYIHFPYKYSPQKQRKFDKKAVNELLRRYPKEAVAKVLQALSSLGERMKDYGFRLVQDATNTVKR